MLLLDQAKVLICVVVVAHSPQQNRLLRDLSDGAPRVKIKAIQRFGHAREIPRQVVPLLASALGDERSENGNEDAPSQFTVADAAETALVAYGVHSVPALIDLLKNSNQISVRSRAARILERIGRQAGAAAPALRNALHSARDEKSRYLFLSAYGKVEQDTHQLAETILPSLDDKSPDICALAIRISGQRVIQDDRIIRRLCDALDDNRARWQGISTDAAIQWPIRADAAKALGRIGQRARSAVPKLESMMKSDRLPIVRAVAAFALCRAAPGSEEALVRLTEMAKNVELNCGNVSALSIQLLGELGPKARPSLPALIDLCQVADKPKRPPFTGSYRSVRMNALQAAAAVGGIEALPALKTGLQSSDGLERWAAATAIAKLGPRARAAVADLGKALFDQRGILAWMARAEAARALGCIGPDARAAVPALRKIAKMKPAKGYEDLPLNAAEALRKILPDGRQ